MGGRKDKAENKYNAQEDHVQGTVMIRKICMMKQQRNVNMIGTSMFEREQNK